MSIEFARVHVLSRSAGHSAVKAAAYRSGENIRDERIGRNADYSHRSGEVLAAKILLPEGADPAFADRKTLWEAVEAREDQHNRRASAQLAKDHIIALPRELSESQRLALAESFAQSEFVSKGMVVDLAIHDHSAGNPHAHLLTTTRVLEGSKFGAKLREQNGKFYGGSKIADAEQLRHRWADHQNAFFKEHGIALSVSNNNGEYQAEKHLGAAFDMNKKGVETALHEEVQFIRSAREKALLDRPEIIIERVADKKAVFTNHDLYRELNRVVDSPSLYSQIKAKLDLHTSLVRMKGATGKEYLTTIEMLKAEHSIRLLAEKLAEQNSRFALKAGSVDSVLKDYAFLSDEQRGAVKHLTSDNRFAVAMGVAGAGKSSMIKAVRVAHEANGHRVLGVALAGKAADELQKSSGIDSSTISSLLYGIKSGRVELGQGDVLVVDEAGMVGNRQMNELLRAAEEAGSKVILVGDTEQIQSIQAGAGLRDLSQKHGYAAIETVRRQRETWQQQATSKFAKGRAVEAVNEYAKRGHLHESDNAIGDLVESFLRDARTGSKAVLAHRVGDVKSLNERIRAELVAQGKLSGSKSFIAHSDRDCRQLAFELEVGDEVVFKLRDRVLGLRADDTGTFVGIEEGALAFVHESGRELLIQTDQYGDIEIPDKPDPVNRIDLSVGERVLFTSNNKTLGVKNGQLGTLVSYRGGELTVQIDEGDRVSFRQEEYSDISHGYATTIHKSQGMTVDHSYVLGSGSLDKHLAYVMHTRHRESVDIFTADKEKFFWALGQEYSQQTALDHIEKMGLEVSSEDHGEALHQLLSEQGIGTMAAELAEVGTVLPTVTEQDYQRAVSFLEAEAKKIAAGLSEKEKAPIAAMRQEANELAAQIEHHKTQEPTALIKTRAFKDKHADWVHRGKTQAAEYKNTLENIQSREMGHLHTVKQAEINKEAYRLAEVKNPHRVKVVENYKTDARIAQLTSRLTQLNKEITRERSSGEGRKLPQLLSQKSTVLRSLNGKGLMSERLGPKEKLAFGKAMEANKRELSIFKDRGLGR